MKIVNEECDYIIKNIKAVNALFDSYEHAKNKLSPWLTREFSKALEKRKKELGDINSITIEDSDDNETYLSFSDYYSDSLDAGVICGFSQYDLDALEETDPKSGFQIYLYFYRPDELSKKNQKIVDEWYEDIKKKINAAKPELLDKYYVPMDDDGYLVTLFPASLNLETLGNDPTQFINDAVDKLFELIEDTKGLLVPVPEG